MRGTRPRPYTDAETHATFGRIPRAGPGADAETIAALGRGSMKTRLPFGTFLAVAALLASLWGEPVIAWYVGLITLQ